MRYVWFVSGLVTFAVLSTTAVPLLPRWMAPNLLALVVIVLAVDDRLSSMNAWAIWSGLVIDLLSPSRFGLVWLPIVILALVLTQIRRVIAVVDLPWLWPVWLFVGTVVAELPLAYLTHDWKRWAASAAVTTVWGLAGLFSIRWIQASRGQR